MIGMFPSYIFYYFLLIAPALAFIQPNILWLDENEVCKKDGVGQVHTCKPLDKCETAIQDIKENVAYPTICSIRGKMPIVCCSPVTISKSKDKILKTTTNDLKNTFDIPPEILLHFTKHRNGVLQDNLIKFTRPRRL
ncbi:uncharacterized protein LOC126904597 [Daktulosphaira vitifoliae]|uniref:uncharacterized protein LOC126904597 n=1 Tax=Daktulosphaira vitifoliae TaxID=58002 RepID=UPI0021A9F6B9|nr:uncharacterized protein LOC126904597 [Daktulosphaira vitifoliae]